MDTIVRTSSSPCWCKTTYPPSPANRRVSVMCRIWTRFAEANARLSKQRIFVEARSCYNAVIFSFPHTRLAINSCAGFVEGMCIDSNFYYYDVTSGSRLDLSKQDHGNHNLPKIYHILNTQIEIDMYIWYYILVCRSTVTTTALCRRYVIIHYTFR